jgi:signal peptide peptidase SppA
MIALAIGLLPFVAIIGAAAGGSMGTGVESQRKIQVLPGADGMRSALGVSGPVLLQVNVVGEIGRGQLTSHQLRDLLAESREGLLSNDRVKGILLRLQTPGGGVFDSFGIYHALQEYKEQFDVPVFAFVDGLCASGGMLSAMAADRIYCTPSGLVGSIGVITAPFINLSGVIEPLGIQTVTVSAGSGKDAMNPLRPWTDDEDHNIREVIGSAYEQFVDLVSSTRPQIDRESLITEYGAHVFDAQRGLEIGYVDEITPTPRKVIRDLAAQAGIEGEAYQVIELAPRFSVAELFQSKLIQQGCVEHRLCVPGQPHPDLEGQLLYLWQANGQAGS